VDSLTWATRGEPGTLDSGSAFGGNSLVILGNVCESLVTMAEDNTIEPLLASKVDHPDPTTYVFTLRDDVKFFDGSTMTADDVVFSLKRTVDPSTGSFFGSYGKNVASVEATGTNQVTVKLTKADPIFYQMLASPMGQVVEKKYVEAAGKAYGTSTSLPMCTGPYEVTSWESGQSISVEANADWWKGHDQLTKTAKFVFATDDATLSAGLKTGEIDGTFYPPASSLGALAESDSLNVYTGPSTTFDALVVTHPGGVIGNPKIREAIRLIIDYNGAAQALFSGNAEPLKALAPSGSWGPEDSEASKIYSKAYNELPGGEQDLEAAKEAVKASGETDPTVVLAVPSFLPDYAAFSHSFAATAKEVGLNVEEKSLPQADFYALYSDAKARAKYDLFSTQWLGFAADPTEIYSAVGLPDGSANFGGYENPDVTKLLEEASATDDAVERAKIVVEAQALIMADLPWIPYVYEYQALTLNKRLAGTPIASPRWEYTAWLAQTGSAK
jgi:peptide/nickel transport system substrate-binding protein